MENDSHRKGSSEEVLEMLSFIKDRMVMKEDIVDMVVKEDIGDMTTRDDLKRFATKEDLKMFPDRTEVREIVEFAVTRAKEDILAEIRPMSRAQDKDAVTIVNHERRITRIEQELTRV